jgi:hypothetical protein
MTFRMPRSLFHNLLGPVGVMSTNRRVRSPPRPLPRRRNPRPAPLLILSETVNFPSFRANPARLPGV